MPNAETVKEVHKSYHIFSKANALAPEYLRLKPRYFLLMELKCFFFILHKFQQENVSEKNYAPDAFLQNITWLCVKINGKA